MKKMITVLAVALTLSCSVAAMAQNDTVVPAPGEPGKMPFWRGDRPGRPIELGRAVGALAGSVRRVLDGGGKAAASGWLRACKTLAFKMKMVLGTDENEHISYLPVIIGCGAAQSGEMRCGYSSWKTTRTWRVSL